MLKKLIPLYITYTLKILFKILLLFASLVLVLLAIKPFSTAYTIVKVIFAGFFALSVRSQIQRLNFKTFLWLIENSNPEFEESLISYYELRKSKSPFLKLLEDRVKEKLQKKLKIQINLLPELKLFLYSMIFILLAFALFPSVYSGLREVPKGQISPYYVIAFKDTTITFRSERRVKFYLLKENSKPLFIAKDTAVQIRFQSEGNYKVFGKFFGFVTTPSIVRIFAKPQIDSFKVYIQRANYMSPTWLAVTEKTPVKIRIFSNPSYKVNIFANSEFIKSGKQLFDFTLVPTQDIDITAEIEYKTLKSKVHLTTISVVPNLPPRIEILEPKVLFSYVPEDMRVKIKARIFDEDGIEVSYLHYILRGGIKRIKTPSDNKIEKFLDYEIDLQKMTMLPGDELRFYILAQDRTGLIDSSQTYTVVFPTLEEIYKEEISKMEKIASEFEKSTESFTKVKGHVLDIIDSLKIQSIKGESTIETDKILQELQSAIQQFSKIQEAIENLQNLSISPELLQKLQKVGEELYSILQKDLPELLKKFESLRDSTGRFDRKIAEELSKKSEEILERLNYLEQLLELAKKELAINDAVEKIQSLLEKRENLQELAKSGNLEELKNLEEQFKAEIAENFSKIQENLKELIPEEEWNEKFSKIQKLQEQILKAVSESNKRLTLKSQEAQREELREMLSHMKNLKQSAIEQQISKLIEMIGSLRRKLLITSLELEDNLNNEKFLPYVMRALERCREEVTKMGILILITSSRVPKLLDLAMDSLYIKPSASLNYLNYAIFDLFRMEAAAKSASQGGGMEAMKMLEKLMKEQASMIRQSGEMMQIPIPMPKNYTSSMIEKISEMKSQMISLYMRSQNQEVREKIEQALKELQKVEDKLKKQEFDNELIESQRKTLKHLLDAYGSYKKEEFTQKRYAEPAKPYRFIEPRTEKIVDPQKISEVLTEIEKLPPQEKRILREYYNKLLLR
uniref:DUF4175 family protein n=1 Tax=candidate division WOR-3 bacterium TaxID=2052148 RepID=A0A7V3ZYR3_UNCW3